jgi:hypothetical protein
MEADAVANAGAALRRPVVKRSGLSEAQPPTIAPGQRIKVETFRPSKVSGTMLSQTDDSLFVGHKNASQGIEWAAIRRISASNGKSHSEGAWRGIKVGAAAGTGIALVIFGGAWLVESREVDQLPWVAVFTGAGTITGVVYGAIIGGAIGAEAWRTVYTRPMPKPAPGLGLTFRF